MFDTRASCHIKGQYEYLENMRSIDFIMVGLPDEMQAIASKMGTVNLGLNLKLKDVLFVLKLTCNLISIY